jgi:leucyl/phenylalanyl-tRNA--protein transferase
MSLFLTPEILINTYINGMFPMADPEDGELYWHTPDPRAIIPLERVKMPRSLKQAIRKENFTFRIDSAFEDVIVNCSQRADTWINEEIIFAYTSLYNLGYAHSVETYKNEDLVGGLYGVSIGGAFFGESMFSSVSNASKAAFYHLVDHLKNKKFILLDSQYLNDHTASLGAIEIRKIQYLNMLNIAVNLPVSF